MRHFVPSYKLCTLALGFFVKKKKYENLVCAIKNLVFCAVVTNVDIGDENFLWTINSIAFFFL